MMPYIQPILLAQHGVGACFFRVVVVSSNASFQISIIAYYNQLYEKKESKLSSLKEFPSGIFSYDSKMDCTR